MVNENKTYNYDCVLNKGLPTKFEQQLHNCLVVKQARFTSEAKVERECKHHYKKTFGDLNRLPPVLFYKRSKEGKFLKTDLQKIADMSLRGLGRDFMKMDPDEKRLYLEKMQFKEEQRALKAKYEMDQEAGEKKLADLKHEIVKIDRQKDGANKNKSFSMIQDLVNEELTALKAAEE